MSKTIDEINQKIEKGKAKVLRADEMTQLVKNLGPEKAAEEVDVVTTGTFGAMCSSGVWLNFGHSEPPIRMAKVWLNEVEAYAGVAAVDAYLGATQPSENNGINYGGSHVIEDLLSGKSITLRAISYGTDCYPRKEILTEITLEDLNFALMSNPRNAYQRYNAATNSSDRDLLTYMGQLQPNFGNINYSGAGEISPLMNDPEYKTMGIGTRIFLGGAQGFITGNGTQHNPQNKFGTLMVQGNLKEMSPEFIRAATFKGYGCSMYIGIGIPIPILDEEIAKLTGISDEDIFTDILDYSVPSRSRPSLKKVSYAELKSGFIELNGKKIPTSPISSFNIAKNIAELLKQWINSNKFKLTNPVESLPRKTNLKGLSITTRKSEIRKTKSEIEDNLVCWDEDRCTHCGLCINICPVKVFSRIDDWKISINKELCISCGDCIELCPVNALRLPVEK
jgi:L-aspartate semialdehyde sulfurtransferase